MKEMRIEYTMRVTFPLPLSRFRAAFQYLLTAVRDRCKDLPDDTACLCETAAFVQSREEERKKNYYHGSCPC